MLCVYIVLVLQKESPQNITAIYHYTSLVPRHWGSQHLGTRLISTPVEVILLSITCTPSTPSYAQAFGMLTVVALAVLIVWLVLFLVYNWNKHMPTPSIISGVVKGVEKEVEGPKLKF